MHGECYVATDTAAASRVYGSGPPVSSRIGICLDLELDMHLQASVECMDHVCCRASKDPASQKHLVCRTKSYALYVNREGHETAIEHCAFLGAKEMQKDCLSSRYLRVALTDARVR